MLVKDKYGLLRASDKDIVDILYSNDASKLFNVLCEPSEDVEKFNEIQFNKDLPGLKLYMSLDIDVLMFDEILQTEWLMPTKYKEFDVYDYLLNKCQSQQEVDRLNEEFEVYINLNFLNVLKYVKFLVDLMREHNILWGVGRGSSVSSFVLYLLELHKINPIKYELDWREFLR